MKSNTAAPFGLTTLVCLVVANMIGAGVFTTSGFTIEALGSPEWVMVAWMIGGVIALCGALSYGGLIRLIPESGGEYLFLARTLGPGWGFLAGWVSLIAGFTGAIAIAATAFESYLVPESSRPEWLPADLVACAAIVIAGCLHGFRVRAGAAAQNSIVALKLVLIVSFVVLAASYWNSDVWQGSRTATSAPEGTALWLTLATSIVWISLSYSGFNAAVYVTDESRQAIQLVPRALVLGTLLVFAIYLVLNGVFVFGPEHTAIAGKEQIAVIAAEAIAGPRAAILIRSLIVVALLTSITSMMMAAPRVYAKMAEDNLFPSWFRFRGETPLQAVVLQVGLAMLIVLVSTLKDLINYLGLTLSLSAAATVACLWIRRNALSRRQRWILWPAGTYVGATVVLAILLTIQQPLNLLGTVLTVASGLAVYWILWRRPPAGDSAAP